MSDEPFDYLIDFYNDSIVPLSEYCRDKGGEYVLAVDRLMDHAVDELNDYLTVIAQKCAFVEEDFLELLDRANEEVYQALVFGMVYDIGLMCADEIKGHNDPLHTEVYCIYNTDVVPNCIALYLLSRALNHGGSSLTQICDTGVFVNADFYEIMEGILPLVDGWNFKCGAFNEETKKSISYYETAGYVGRYFNEWNYYQTREPIAKKYCILDISRDYDGTGGNHIGEELSLERLDDEYFLRFPDGRVLFCNRSFGDDLIGLMKNSKIFVTGWEEGYDDASVWIGIYKNEEI